MTTDEARDSRTQGADFPPWYRPVPGGVELRLHVQPGARRLGLVGVHGDRLKLAVGAPASDCRANEAVLDLLAQLSGVSRRCVQLVSGAASRDKRVRVATAAGDELLPRLRAALG